MVTGDLLLIGSCSGNFFALNRHDGSEVWRYDTRRDGDPLTFHGDPALDGNTIITCSDNGDPSCTYAFDLADGAVIWRNCEDSIESDVILSGSSAIGRTWNGDLVALDLEGGDRLWRLAPEIYRYRMRIDDSPLLQAGILYFGHVDGAIQAVRAEDGEPLWQRPLGNRIATLAVDGERLCAGTADGIIHRLSLEDGSVTGTMEIDAKPLGRASLANGILVLLLGEAELAAFDAEELIPLWSQPSDAGWSSYQPLLREDSIIVGDGMGHLFEFALADGSLLNSAELEGRVRGLGATDDVLYAGTLQGDVFALRWE